MKSKLLTLFLFVFAIPAYSQLVETDKWKNYENQTVDSTVDGFRFKGTFVNSKREGYWLCYDQYGDLKQDGYFLRDTLLQLERIDGDDLSKNYLDYTKKIAYFTTENQNSITVLLTGITPGKENFFTLKEAWYSTSNRKIFDTTYGLKKLPDGKYCDRNNVIYEPNYSNVKITDHELTDEQIIIGNSGENIMKKKVYVLTTNRKMEFNNGQLKKFVLYWPVITSLNTPKPQYSFKSVRKDVIAINDTSSIKKTMFYEMIIDDKPVLKGSVNKNGSLEGQWDFYHFTYYDVQDDKRTAAFSLQKIFEFSNIVQGDAPLSNLFYFKDFPTSTLSDISVIANTNEYLNKINKVFVAIDEPYLFTKYATYTRKDNEINLEDNLGYHLFQRLYFNDGNLVKGYSFTPDGKLYDSINWNKDEFGERITKNNAFKPYPEHPMAQAYQKQLVDGVKEFVNNVNSFLDKKNEQDWKNVRCKQCNKPVDKNTAIIVDGITCGNVGYPGGGIFCSNKCRFEYEEGYCRTLK